MFGANLMISDFNGLMEAGERVFNLEKMFNLREGFSREDDSLPERFFAEAFTLGPKKGAKLDRQEFNELMDSFYAESQWDKKTTRPTDEKLK